MYHISQKNYFAFFGQMDELSAFTIHCGLLCVYVICWFNGSFSVQAEQKGFNDWPLENPTGQSFHLRHISEKYERTWNTGTKTEIRHFNILSNFLIRPLTTVQLVLLLTLLKLFANFLRHFFYERCQSVFQMRRPQLLVFLTMAVILQHRTSDTRTLNI